MRHGLRLPGQLLEVVRVAHQALSRPHAVAAARLVAAGEGDLAGADERVDIETLPPRRHRVGRAAQLHRRLPRHSHDPELPRLERGRRQLAQSCPLLLPPRTVTVRGIDRSQHAPCDLLQSAPLRHRTHVRQTDSLAARLHAALVVPLARAGEARLEQVVAHQRLEPSRQPTLAAHPATHRGTQIVIDQAQRHAAEVRERSHVAVEECHLVAPVVQPHERTARVRQVQQELPHPVRHAVLLHRHLEEVHLATLAGTVHQRYERLLPLTLPLKYVAAHRCDPDLVALLQQLAMQTHSRQTLLRRRPARPRAQQLLQTRRHTLRHPATPGLALHPPRLALIQVLAHRVAAHTVLPGHRALAPTLHQHLVPNNMYLIHPQQVLPPIALVSCTRPSYRPRAEGGSLSER